MEQVLQLLEPLLALYGGKLGFLPQVIAVIGSARLFIKPVVSLARAYVDFTPSTADNLAMDKVLDSKVYKAVVFLVDWFASIKLPQKK